MNLEQLRTAGAFIDAEPVKTPITWKEHHFDVYIRRLNFGDMERISASGNSTINLIAIVALSGTVAKLTRDYLAQRKAGKMPTFPFVAGFFSARYLMKPDIIFPNPITCDPA